MGWSLQAETIISFFAAVGIVALMREGWLWLFRRADKHAPQALLTISLPECEDLGYIECACEEIKRYYFPGLVVLYGADGQETANDKPAHDG